MRVLFARAACRYEGRISAELTLGDVLICLREQGLGGDGSCLVLDPTRGMLPRNWMPAGSVIVERPGGFLVAHAGKGESLEIFVDEVYSDERRPAGFTGELRKMGAEREFSDLIAADLLVLDPDGGLELIAREWRTPAGPVDLLLRDLLTGRPVVVEVKRNRIAWGDAYQLKRYMDALGTMQEWAGLPPRGLLVAPVLAKNARPLIEQDPALGFVRLGYADLRPAS